MDVREKLVELIKEGIRKGLRAKGDDRLDYSFEDVADYLISNGVTVQGDKDINVPTKWIPVTERLPEIGIVVLVYSEDNGICVDYYDGDLFGYHDITHWMPIPQPPKGE